MADDGAIEIRGTQPQMFTIHSNLKDAIGKITAGKSIKKEQRQELETMLLKVYQDVVEESVRGYVKVGGEGLNSVSTATCSNKDCTTSEVEVTGPLTEKRSDEVDMMFSKLEAVIKSCSNKRKCYPQQISQLLDQSYHHRQDVLEKYVPAIRRDLGLSTNTRTVNSAEELESCAERLEQVSSAVAELSKAIQTIVDKAGRLSKSYEVHKPMEECGRTESVLFTRKKQRRSLDETLAKVSNSLADRSTESPKPSKISKNIHKRKSNSPRCVRKSSNI